MAVQAANRRRAPKRRAVSKREKAHMYAASIKKPVQSSQQLFGMGAAMASDKLGGNDGQDNAYGGVEPQMEDLSPLDQMELEHERNRDSVAAIRAGYGF